MAGRFVEDDNEFISVWSCNAPSSFDCNGNPCTICGYDTDVMNPLVTAKCLNTKWSQCDSEFQLFFHSKKN